MFNDWCYMRLQDRAARERELDELMGERQRQTSRAACKPSLRARMARRLFALAVAQRGRRPGTWSGSA